MQRVALRTSLQSMRTADGRGSAEIMAGKMKARFAIAVFDQVADLRRAVAALFEKGFLCRQLGIVSRATVLAKARAAGGELGTGVGGSAFDEMVSEVTILPKSVRGGDVVATRQSLWQFPAMMGRSTQEDLFVAPWMASSLRSELAGYIESGAIVLGVIADSLDQQRQSTRILLHYSSHRVQTHEFSI